MKFAFWLMGLLVSVMIALIPESVMYFTYHLIAPQSDLARVLILAIFWLAGAGVCIGFAALGLVLFVAVTKVVLE